MSRILVAEDSPTGVQFVKTTLAGMGHDLVIAVDGEEAWDKIRKDKFDLVILDVVMPKKNGFQVCRDMKRHESLKELPVILLTSKDQPSDRMWGEKQGADEYLTKPCEPDQLINAVKKQLQR